MIVQRDINSAYPWACTLLPCLVHGTWHKTKYPTLGGVYIAKYQFRHGADSRVCHLPVRAKTGAISFPLTGSGWYWSPEVEASRRAGTRADAVGYTWEYVPDCDCDPFGFIRGLYDERLRLGKTGRGLVIKLGLNSLYGKTAQSIGAAPYANPVYAGLITALTRARIIDDYTRIGAEHLVMVATDGVFYTLDGPDGFDTGTGLGQWEEVTHPSMFVIQPGVYFLSDKVAEPKTRGVPQKAVAELLGEFERRWDAGVLTGLEVPVHAFTGIRLAYARGKPETAGVWTDAPKKVGFEWRTKRSRKTLYWNGNGWQTVPLDGGAETVPYSKMIGRNIITAASMDELWMSEQPEEKW